MYAAYAKLSAMKGYLLSDKDIEKVESASTYNDIVVYVNKRFNLDFNPDIPTLDFISGLRSCIYGKFKNLCRYLEDEPLTLFRLLLSYIDIYQLKALLILHFCDKDVAIKGFLSKETPLYNLYGYLAERSHLVDSDILEAFSKSAFSETIFTAYRQYKENRDLFLFDIMLDNGYWQLIADKICGCPDAPLADLVRDMLLLRNIDLGIRLLFIKGISKEKVFPLFVGYSPEVRRKVQGLFGKDERSFIPAAVDVLSSITQRYGVSFADVKDLDAFHSWLDAVKIRVVKANAAVCSWESLTGLYANILLQQEYINKIERLVVKVKVLL